MFKGIIHKIVLREIKKRIQNAEIQYKKGCDQFYNEMLNKQLDLQMKLVSEILNNTGNTKNG